MSKIAVIIPCYNEETTIARVVNDFRQALPSADIYVYDNNSRDNTVEEAAKAGAIVRHEKRQGKGNVVRAMFRQIDADVYVMVDGDGTYPPEKVHDLITPVLEDRADMTTGSRLLGGSAGFRLLNLIGNRIFLAIINAIFREKITDLLTGYRAFNRRVAKGLPVISRGFEIETELTLKSLERSYRLIEVPVDLTHRPEGSKSKIRIFRDGVRILNTIFALFRDYKPLTAFSSVGLFLIFCGFIPGSIVIHEYILTKIVSRVPLAILSTGLVLSGLLVSFVGLILHTISRRFQELDCQLQNIAEGIQDIKRTTSK